MKIYSKENFIGCFAVGLLFTALVLGQGHFLIAFLFLVATCTMMIASCLPKTGKAMAEKSQSDPRAVLYREVFGGYGGYAPFVTVGLFALSQVVMVWWPDLFVVGAVILVGGFVHFAWFLMKLHIYKRSKT